MNIEEYCIEKGKAELLKNFMLDIDPISNMGGAESAIFTNYYDKKHLFNFKCHICNTEWQGSAYSYIVKELTCPECNENSTHQKNKYASHKRGSITVADWCDDNEERGKQLREEWTGIDEDGNEVDINKVSFGSDKKVFWKCRYGHRWITKISERTRKTRWSNCPECANKIKSMKNIMTKTNSENSLSTWCLNNERGKQIQSEWTGISESGEHYTMGEVAYGSHIKMLWRNKECGHEWYAIIWSRVNGSNCPECNKRSTSYPEQYLYWALKQLYPETQNRYKAFKDIDSRGIELDVYIKELNLAIEYSPTVWHKGKEKQDSYKKQLCEQNNIHLIRIIEDNYNEYTKEYREDYICIPTLEYSNRDDYLQKILSYILNYIGHSINEIDIELVKKNALDYSKKKIEYVKSLEYNYPELCKEWNYEFNSIKPSEVTCGSSLEWYWTCTNCNYGENGEWSISINNRVSKRSGCPRCGYNWSDGEIHQTMGSTVIYIGINDLQSQYPELAKEWHPTLNDKLPSEVKYSSGVKGYWICPYCNYGENGEWVDSPNGRAAKGYKTGCPRCHYNWYKEETGQPQNIKSQYRNLHKVTIDKEYDLRRALNNPVIKYEGEYDF
ncbi:MAG: zinc-ribbon domain-containing protein [Lachnospiraceae bacterium]|nr:zinc-ribbon domain-containing protein [Lachnospiraceae bacterium]